MRCGFVFRPPNKGSKYDETSQSTLLTIDVVPTSILKRQAACLYVHFSASIVGHLGIAALNQLPSFDCSRCTLDDRIGVLHHVVFCDAPPISWCPDGWQHANQQRMLREAQARIAALAVLGLRALLWWLSTLDCSCVGVPGHQTPSRSTQQELMTEAMESESPCVVLRAHGTRGASSSRQHSARRTAESAGDEQSHHQCSG